MRKSATALMVSLLLTTFVAAGEVAKVPLGQEVKTEGVIVSRSDDSFQVRAHRGPEYRVVFGPGTEIEEKKKNFFRGARQFGPDDLVLGLNVRVEGRGDTSGAILAEEVKFTQDELKVAQTIASRVVPVEGRLDETETRLRTAEGEISMTREHFSNQVEELDEAFRLAREEARDAQQTAENAMGRAETVDQRVTALDRYQEVVRATVTFDFNSWELTPEAQTELGQLAADVIEQPGVLIEVAGFASSDGNPEYNRILSERRADAVVDYLVETLEIPLRRIVRPYGFGENRPAADNSTREGRQKNRRVEVRVLQSEGLAPEKVNAALRSEDLGTQ